MDDAPRQLADIPLGSSAVVSRVRCDRGVSRRLMEMGLLPGTPITLTRTAPMGDPLELRIRDYSLSIRRSEASAVWVTAVRIPVEVVAAASESST